MFYTNELPFVDIDLTDGIVALLVAHVNKITSRDDIHQLVPGLSEVVVDDIISIVKDMFDF